MLLIESKGDVVKSSADGKRPQSLCVFSSGLLAGGAAE